MCKSRRVLMVRQVCFKRLVLEMGEGERECV